MYRDDERRSAGPRLPGGVDPARATSCAASRTCTPCSWRTETGWTSARATRARMRRPDSVEAWGRAADNPVGGWYGLRKGYRGRFGMYVPPLLERLGLAELTHEKRNNRMRAQSRAAESRRPPGAQAAFRVRVAQRRVRPRPTPRPPRPRPRRTPRPPRPRPRRTPRLGGLRLDLGGLRLDRGGLRLDAAASVAGAGVALLLLQPTTNRLTTSAPAAMVFFTLDTPLSTACAKRHVS